MTKKQKRINEIAEHLYNSQKDVDLTDPFKIAEWFYVQYIGSVEKVENMAFKWQKRYDDLLERYDKLMEIDCKNYEKIIHLQQELDLLNETFDRLSKRYAKLQNECLRFELEDITGGEK